MLFNNSTTSNTVASTATVAKRIIFEQRPALKRGGVPIIGKDGQQLLRIWMGVAQTELLNDAEKIAAATFLNGLDGKRQTFEARKLAEGRAWYFVGDSWGQPDPKQLEYVCTGLRQAIANAMIVVAPVKTTMFGGRPLTEMPKAEAPKVQAKVAAIVW